MTETRPVYLIPDGGRAKYGNRKVVLDGIRFDSQAEASRYGELKLLERAGEIELLAVHPVYRFSVSGIFIGRYTPDFQYQVKGEFDWIVEDVKSEETRKHRAYRRNLKLMWACHHIKVKEVLA